MTFKEMYDVIASKAETESPIGAKVKFKIGDQSAYIDGTGEKNVVTEADDEADTVIIASEEDFAALMAGDLNPMGAVMMGKVKIKGDMGIAMKLQSFMGG